MKSAVLAALITASLAICPADTLYLKSGLSITVTRAEEHDDQISYWVGRDHYTINKDRVLRIEKGDAPATPGAPVGSAGVQDLTRRSPSTAVPSHDKLDLPSLALPKANGAYWNELGSRIMIRDTISDQHLAELEREHDEQKTADAYLFAAMTEIERGDTNHAAAYLDHAIRAMPQRVDLLQWQALALTHSGRYPEATTALERANSLQPNSPEILRLLGMARYNSDRTADAIAAWKRAQDLSADPTIAALLRKSQRELDVEEKSASRESHHFTLHYQGERTSPEMQQQILAALENGYQDVARQFAFEPRENIIVILYTQKEFSEITGAPSWSGAVNDGKLRIPVGGISSVPPSLERILRHEITHSFVHSLGGARCPVWLNEGLAQLMEPRSASAYAVELRPLLLERKAVPFAVLEHSFMNFSDFQARIAYAQSLAAVEYLRDRYGMSEIVRMLQSIASGVEPETALRGSTGTDYSTLQERIGQHMTGRQ